MFTVNYKRPVIILGSLLVYSEVSESSDYTGTHNAQVQTTHNAHVQTTHNAHVQTTHNAHVQTTHNAHVQTTHNAHVQTTHNAHGANQNGLPLFTLQQQNVLYLDSSNLTETTQEGFSILDKNRHLKQIGV